MNFFFVGFENTFLVSLLEVLFVRVFLDFVIS